MGRSENPVSGSGPVADFAQQLRLLRQQAALTLRQVAASTGLSTATLSGAASGRKLPTWDVASGYVQACGGNTDDWRMRWEHAARFSRSPSALQLPGGAAPTSGVRSGGNRRGFAGGPAPLPVTAESVSEFMGCLWRVKIWAGDPPVRALSRRAGLPPSTMQDFLQRERRTLPAVEMVCAFLGACGVDDSSVIAEWVYAWRRLKLAEIEKRRIRARRVLVSALRVRWPRRLGSAVEPGVHHVRAGSAATRMARLQQHRATADLQVALIEFASQLRGIWGRNP